VDGSGGTSTSRLRVGACLSLSGRFSRFGRQAARGLETWRSLDGTADLVIEDDGSDTRTLRRVLPDLARRSDLLLGPYSTLLMKTAGEMAAEAGWLLWNHGGSGDDVEAAHPGNIASILTPASRYAEPFLRHLSAGPHRALALRIAHGRGRFGRQVASGAHAYARELGITSVIAGPADDILEGELPAEWALFSAGTFEEDIDTIIRARNLAQAPRLICAVAAGVREFQTAIKDPAGTFGIAQWFPSSGQHATLGPAEAEFLGAYTNAAGIFPDYPAVQAAAGAVLATHCARLAKGTSRTPLWSAATALETSTLFGSFKIAPDTGVQVSHRTVLIQWTAWGPQAIRDIH
jgi:hypothetical protein